MESITLMEAYAIETLRGNGISNDKIIENIRANDLEEFKTIKENMDFDALVELDKNADFESIVNDGYKVKFLTFNGLKNLIKMKFGKFADEDYQVDEFVISGLELDENQQKDLENILSANWTLSSEAGGITVKPTK
ncbi:hypothetical protein E4T89_02035 [Jeotgalicoccus nanhaiensis]|uniref:General stress protein 17M-like domain-containing protein n=1 Tax=Jeotgalicoccus nanhaiensis TaxID=568603 RepID=A0ABR9XWD0_9STAP|nr:hypothetical protein [Jeotgalicoccus nanhaiensis]MBF0753036.1 hypothetical protein [Jeotgalicoccus nanhaiensis]TFU63187.1 hypothetical protein E4T89_02035 [Jeotgalicoccus nanhaiensis]